MRKQLHGVWVTELQCADGACAVVADHGGQLLSWMPAQGGPGLYLSERSQYGGASAIRGGVPIIFPQFAERGPGMRHGFARRLNWHQVFAGEEQGRMVARYRLSQLDAVGQGWSHPFDLAYEIAFAGQELHMSLTVHNRADYTWEFAAALHTYLQVGDIGQVDIFGLQGKAYLDTTKAGLPATQDADALHVVGEVDRIYPAVLEPVIVSDGERTTTVRKQGFGDVVIWNPGPAAQLADMEPNDFRSFICVEAGAIVEPIQLRAGEQWCGSQSLTIGSGQSGVGQRPGLAQFADPGTRAAKIGS